MVLVVINDRFGGFSISDEAVRWIRANAPCQHKEVLTGERYDDGSIKGESSGNILKDFNNKHYGGSTDWSPRSCPSLIAAIRTLKTRANGPHASLKIVKIPEGTNWEISDYDGNETVEEQHQSWS